MCVNAFLVLIPRRRVGAWMYVSRNDACFPFTSEKKICELVIQFVLFYDTLSQESGEIFDVAADDDNGWAHLYAEEFEDTVDGEVNLRNR